MTRPEIDGAGDALDALLAEWTTPPPSAALRERIVASARLRAPRRGLWFAGAAGLGLAGALAGAVAAAHLTTVSAPAPTLGDPLHPGDTVFGDLGDGMEG